MNFIRQYFTQPNQFSKVAIYVKHLSYCKFAKVFLPKLSNRKFYPTRILSYTVPFKDLFTTFEALMEVLGLLTVNFVIIHFLHF